MLATEILPEMKKIIEHIPVMNREVLEGLNCKQGDIVLDCTLGLGGHASGLLEKIGPQGRLIGIDRDAQALALARERLGVVANQCHFVHSDFRYVDRVLADLNLKTVNVILLDLGVSSMQLDDPQRGFSIREEGPLDMRMDQDNFISAYDIVNSLSERELAFILKKYGEERWHNRIARVLVQQRSRRPIETTKELGDIVRRAIPANNRYQKIHPATRTFQAIRIAVNRELESLEIVLNRCANVLAPGGRLCVISFHSLEDRIVKNMFRALAKDKIADIITKKPLRPGEEEILQNPRSRSARLRIIEKL